MYSIFFNSTNIPSLLWVLLIHGYKSGPEVWNKWLPELEKEGIKVNEVFPVENAAEVFDLMMSGKARFRAILTTEH